MNIVFLDAFSVGEIDLSEISKLGNYTGYQETAPNEVVGRCRDAEVVITNKVKLMKAELEALPKLKLICVAATGVNNVDVEYAAKLGIEVKNVVNYSSESVAQTTFSLALALIQHTHYYDQYVKSGAYSQSGQFTHHGRPYFELNGKKWGIIGLGNIGKQVARIATAFGAEVSYFSTSGKNLSADYPHKPLTQLLSDSDVVSIHAPLNFQTQNLLTYDQICLMKKNALLINVGRGGIVNESDLAKSLKENRIAGAGIDVFGQEPVAADNPLLSSDIQEKIVVAPHIAWASLEARQKLIGQIRGHILSYIGSNR